MIRAGRHQAIGVWADEKRVRVDIRGACMAHSARSPEAELAEHPAIAIDDTARLAWPLDQGHLTNLA